VGVGVSLSVTDGVTVGVGVGVSLDVTDGEVSGVGVGVSLSVTDGVTVGVGVGVSLSVTDGVTVGVGVGVQQLQFDVSPEKFHTGGASHWHAVDVPLIVMPLTQDTFAIAVHLLEQDPDPV
jgi:hypothetical protein